MLTRSLLLMTFLFAALIVATWSNSQAFGRSQITPANSQTVLPQSRTPTIVPSPTPTATPLPDDVIVYAANEIFPETFELFLMTDTGQIIDIVENAVGELVNAPALLPDQRLVVFENLDEDGDMEIYQADLLTGSVEPLTRNDVDDFGPRWSPNGEEIAFHSSRDGNLDIYILDRFDLFERPLTDDPGADLFASWSPDGQRLVYQCEIGGGREICIIDRNGDNRLQLTDNDRFDGLPDWSPDGERIAFASTRDEAQDEIYIMNSDGSGVQRLTNRPDSLDTHPRWSADGERIVFESNSGGDYEICIMRSDGSELTCITDNPFTDWSADW